MSAEKKTVGIPLIIFGIGLLLFSVTLMTLPSDQEKALSVIIFLILGGIPLLLGLKLLSLKPQPAPEPEIDWYAERFSYFPEKN